VVEFLGYVRASEDGTRITGIDYEAFVQMVEHQFGLIFDAIEQRWPIASVRLVHRVGFVAVGEPSLWVEVVAPHRAEAFAACQHLIDEMKRVVPIWKRPVGAREGSASEQLRPD
jgi:molybdopterin synthase catalytic subunit